MKAPKAFSPAAPVRSRMVADTAGVAISVPVPTQHRRTPFAAAIRRIVCAASGLKDRPSPDTTSAPPLWYVASGSESNVACVAVAMASAGAVRTSPVSSASCCCCLLQQAEESPLEAPWTCADGRAAAGGLRRRRRRRRSGGGRWTGGWSCRG